MLVVYRRKSDINNERLPPDKNPPPYSSLPIIKTSPVIDVGMSAAGTNATRGAVWQGE
jgi:hypothetical protein